MAAIKVIGEDMERRALCTSHAERLVIIETEIGSIKDEMKPLRGIRNILVVVSILMAVLVYIYLEDRGEAKEMRALLFKHATTLERAITKIEALEMKPKPAWVPG